MMLKLVLEGLFYLVAIAVGFIVFLVVLSTAWKIAMKLINLINV